MRDNCLHGAVLYTVLHVCIVLIHSYITLCRAPKGTPQSQLHWHNSGPTEDSPWVLTHSRKSASISQKALTETNMSAVADEL